MDEWAMSLLRRLQHDVTVAQESLAELRDWAISKGRYQGRLWRLGRRIDNALDSAENVVSGLIGRPSWEEWSEMAKRYGVRDDGMMISLQRVPDPRGFDEQLVRFTEMEEWAQQDADQWNARWEKRGYTAGQCQLLRSAFAQLESAWIVFWESGDPDRALWRLVDACGLLAEVFPEDRKEATGRGYRIEKTRAFGQPSHRWGGDKPQEDRDGRRAFSSDQKRELYFRAGGRCSICRATLTANWHADHVIPWSVGGETDIKNGQALCQPCNSRKHAKVLTVDE